MSWKRLFWVGIPSSNCWACLPPILSSELPGKRALGLPPLGGVRAVATHEVEEEAF